MKKPRILTYHKVYSLEYLRFCKWINKTNEDRKRLAELREKEYIPIPTFTNTQVRFAMWLLKSQNKKELIRIGNMNSAFELVTQYLKLKQ